MAINDIKDGKNVFNPKKRVTQELGAGFVDKIEMNALSKLGNIGKSSGARRPEEDIDDNEQTENTMNKSDFINKTASEIFHSSKNRISGDKDDEFKNIIGSSEIINNFTHNNTFSKDKKIARNEFISGCRENRFIENRGIELVNLCIDSGTCGAVMGSMQSAFNTTKDVSGLAITTGLTASANFINKSTFNFYRPEFNKVWESSPITMQTLNKKDMHEINIASRVEHIKYGARSTLLSVVAPAIATVAVDKIMPKSITSAKNYKYIPTFSIFATGGGLLNHKIQKNIAEKQINFVKTHTNGDNFHKNVSKAYTNDMIAKTFDFNIYTSILSCVASPIVSIMHDKRKEKAIETFNNKPMVVKKPEVAKKAVTVKKPEVAKKPVVAKKAVTVKKPVVAKKAV